MPTTGAGGADGTVFITTLADEVEVHPEALVTVKVNVPVISPEMVVLVPVPLMVALPGDLVKVQLPDAGKPLNTTLPVARAQVG